MFARVRRLRYTLRWLSVAVLLVSIGLAAWIQRGRYWVYRMANSGGTRAVWDQLLEYNGIDLPSFQQGTPRNIWPQRRVWPPGYLWVQTVNNDLFCLSPSGNFLGSPVPANRNVQALWNGSLPDGTPGIIIFGPKEDETPGCVIYCSPEPTAEENLYVNVRLRVAITAKDVRVKCIESPTGPIIELTSADGTLRHQFNLRWGPWEYRTQELPGESTRDWAFVCER